MKNKKKPIKQTAKKAAKKWAKATFKKKPKAKKKATKVKSKKVEDDVDKMFGFNQKQNEADMKKLIEFFGQENLNMVEHEAIFKKSFGKLWAGFLNGDTISIIDIVKAFEEVAGDMPLRQLLFMISKATSKLVMANVHYNQQMIHPDDIIKALFGGARG